jgi:hypothetical protein
LGVVDQLQEVTKGEIAKITLATRSPVLGEFINQ